MRKTGLALLIGVIIFAVCFALVWGIGRALASTVPGLQPVVLLVSVLIALAMTVRVIVEIKRAGRR